MGGCHSGGPDDEETLVVTVNVKSAKNMFVAEGPLNPQVRIERPGSRKPIVYHSNTLKDHPIGGEEALFNAEAKEFTVRATDNLQVAHTT